MTGNILVVSADDGQDWVQVEMPGTIINDGQRAWVQVEMTGNIVVAEVLSSATHGIAAAVTLVTVHLPFPSSLSPSLPLFPVAFAARVGHRRQSVPPLWFMA